jgi:hypothetical protein
MPEITTPIDSPWKKLIEQYFEQFMVFFFPDIHAMIDWTRGYEFLDQEFQQIVRDAELGKRLADKLVKAWEKNGEPAIIYTKVQGQYDKSFEQRMFISHYRIYDRFRKPIISVAILGDSSPNWRPRCFGSENEECRLSFQFPIVKLLDYKEREEELKQSSNPFAAVVRIHLKGLETREAPEQRFYWKKELAKALYDAKYSRKEVLELFHFMDWMLKLPKELANQFDDYVKEYEENKKVEYVTHIERRALEKGQADGQAKGQAKMLIRLLEEKFGLVDKDTQTTIYRMDENRLVECAKRIFTAPTLGEVIGQ